MSKAMMVAQPIGQMLPGAFFAQHREAVAATMMRVLDSGWYILGDEVRAFENEFASYFGMAEAVGVANGTDAIALALRALGVGPGDRVATVSHTAVATVAAIEMANAMPVLADINPNTYTLDPQSLARTLECFAPVKAVIVVHLYGHCAGMPAILKLAAAHNAFVIEDCSQAHGAALDGRPAGTMGNLASFSFYPTKNLGALGDGGLVAGNDPELMARVRSLREYGWQERYVSAVPGVNSRLDELQAALLRFRLPFLAENNQRRRVIAALYSQSLADTGVVLPFQAFGATHVYHQYVIRMANRDGLRDRLKGCGIGTNIHYPVPVHLQPAYAGRCGTDPAGLKVTEAVAGEILSLPMYPELMDDAVDDVIAALRHSL